MVLISLLCTIAAVNPLCGASDFRAAATADERHLEAMSDMMLPFPIYFFAVLLCVVVSNKRKGSESPMQKRKEEV
jgi:hypothetical protein